MAEANTPVTETNQNMAENSGGDPTQPVRMYLRTRKLFDVLTHSIRAFVVML